LSCLSLLKRYSSPKRPMTPTRMQRAETTGLAVITEVPFKAWGAGGLITAVRMNRMAPTANAIAETPIRSSIAPLHPGAKSRNGRPCRVRCRPAYRVLHCCAHVVLRVLAVVTLAVPTAYFIWALLVAGILRQDLVVGSLRNWMEAIVRPGQAIAGYIFAIKMEFRGLDLVLVGWGVVALALREIVLHPFRKLKDWAKDKLETTIATPGYNRPLRWTTAPRPAKDSHNFPRSPRVEVQNAE
jgi:hypothetical protein